jgi:hypothetical protein
MLLLLVLLLLLLPAAVDVALRLLRQGPCLDPWWDWVCCSSHERLLEACMAVWLCWVAAVDQLLHALPTPIVHRWLHLLNTLLLLLLLVGGLPCSG